jgi:hypothetical protein
MSLTSTAVGLCCCYGWLTACDIYIILTSRCSPASQDQESDSWGGPIFHLALCYCAPAIKSISGEGTIVKVLAKLT